MAVQKNEVRRTQSGKIDKRTKEGKEILERMAAARAAKKKKEEGFLSRIVKLFGK